MPVQLVNSIELHYEHQAGPSGGKHYPLLMLSGMASDSGSWQPVREPLASHFELIIPDNRCTGRTLPNPIETSRDLMVADILALLDTLDIDKVNVVGHSMGAMLGWALAAQEPSRVNHLIGASALPFVIPARVSLFKSLSALRLSSNEEDWFALLFQFLFSATFFENTANVEHAVAASTNYPHKQSAESFAAQAAALSSFLPPIDTSKVSCKVSMLSGSNDVLMTPSSLEEFCQHHKLPCTFLDNAAHAIHWEQPEAFVDHILSELG